MKNIDIKNLCLENVTLWMNRWLLLTTGTMHDCNMMTVAWGSIGCMWRKPFAQIVVRPQRHTYNYLEKHDSFTLCAFPKKHREDLEIMGSVSGKDGNKLKQTSLTLKPSKFVSSPCYKEANLILECKKIYFQDMDPKGFLDKNIIKNYPLKDYHRIYYGEILAAFCEG